MNELYNILSIFVTSGLLLACGLMFLFAFIPGSPLLGNYRKARYTMAGAYLFFIAVAVVEYLSGDPSEQSVLLMQAVTLVIAASQAFLFTFALLALIEVQFSGWRYIFREAAVVWLFIVAVFTVYAGCSETFFRAAFYVFTIIYALLLARYTVLFLKSYRQFRCRMDNYYSGEEAGRLRWVALSFFAALAVGIMALLSALFMSIPVALLYAVVFDAFYLFFAVRFINYPHQFRVIEQAMDDEPEKTGFSLNGESAARNGAKTAHTAFAALEKQIEHWVAGKGFTEQGITLGALAARLHTNNKYLSTYINTRKKQTFREWINKLRIEEAQSLLLQYPGMKINEIAHKTGFLDKSHFLRQFKKQNKQSPTAWRNHVRTHNSPVQTPGFPV
ncbi:MAG: helix-turn-helix domain-containing protein [Tannerellaceae bacterium]|jgi:AraC-like DNA-binding protein|nr:helix-turn-helix domain-containing protein [Tannerellaceae bacterium]